jgi:uncharacterized protein
MTYGLLERDWALIIATAKAFPEISQLILFGSRAKGTYKTGSDIDLAIKGERANYDTAIRLSEVLNEELPLPYFFDVLRYEDIHEPRLVEHINRVGVVVYDRMADANQATYHE